MKIAQYIDSYYPVIDGVVVTVKNYADLINRKEHECIVVTVKHNDYKDLEGYKILRSKSMTLPFDKILRLPLPFLDFKLKKEIKNYNVDLIHAHSPFFIGKLGIKEARKRGIPIVATFHSKFYDDFLGVTKSKFISKLLLKNVVSFFNKVDYVWTVNENTKKTLQDYGFKGNIEIMPNGVDLVLPDNKDILIKQIREEYDISKNDDVFLFVGQHEWKKNIRKIFEAIKLYKGKRTNFKFLMVGTGNAANELSKLSKEFKIDDCILFLGKVSDRNKLTSIYLMADVFVFPSLYDNAPLVVREAAICECPSIVVKNTGASENIISDENGFLCDDTSESIYEAMLKSVSDKNNLKKIAVKASKTIPISWDNVVDKVLLRYEEIINDFKNKTPH